MKTILAIIVSLVAVPAFAGWGAIAYNSQTQQVAASSGYFDLGTAENNALASCQAQAPYAQCQIMNWENQECIAIAAGGGHWGRAQGFYNSASAGQAAVGACGNAACVVLRSVCN